MGSWCLWACIHLGKQQKMESDAASSFPRGSTPPSFQALFLTRDGGQMVYVQYPVHLLLVITEARILHFQLMLHGCSSVRTAGSETELRLFFP